MIYFYSVNKFLSCILKTRNKEAANHQRKRQLCKYIFCLPNIVNPVFTEQITDLTVGI